MVSMGEHYRAIDEADVPLGSYRIVGLDDEAVTVLRVTDADGRRLYTGEIDRLPRETIGSAFEPADDPDAGFAPVASLRNAVQGVVWSIRSAFGR